jgi:hypothetical protein
MKTLIHLPTQNALPQVAGWPRTCAGNSITRSQGLIGDTV